MGNCQAAEAATVLIQHPDGKLERAYWSLSAADVMAANPGHYVAAVINSSSSVAAAAYRHSSRSSPVKHLKLLRPDDTLHIGHAYRLVSFEEVLREFGSKKSVRLSRILGKQREERRKRENEPAVAEEQKEEEPVGSGVGTGVPRKQGQWRPSLQSIAEVGVDTWRGQIQ